MDADRRTRRIVEDMWRATVCELHRVSTTIDLIEAFNRDAAASNRRIASSCFRFFRHKQELMDMGDLYDRMDLMHAWLAAFARHRKEGKPGYGSP